MARYLIAATALSVALNPARRKAQMVGTKKCEYVGLTPLLTSSKII